MSRSLTTVAAVVAAAIALSGCVSLFPKAKPAQLYRFGIPAASTDAAAGPGKTFEVIGGSADFTQAAATDRILTVTGNEGAYIAGARWIAPAPTLFEEAMANAFASDPAAPRLVSVGAASRAAAVLRVEVIAFEAVYDQGQEAAPEVVVRVRAHLSRNRDRLLLGERTFEARRRAADNRVSAIVPAFDAATGDVLHDLTGWTAGFAGAVF